LGRWWDCLQTKTYFLLIPGWIFLQDAKREKRDKKAKKPKKAVSGGDHYELSRYTPILKGVLEDHVAGSLDMESFPYLGAQPTPESNTKTGGTSLRSTKPSWQKKGPGGTATAGGAATAGTPAVPKIYVFVLGGVTYSEIRSIYEVAADSGKELIIGSTHLVTPAKFVSDLKGLRTPGAFPGPAFGTGQGPQTLPDAPKRSTLSYLLGGADAPPQTPSADDGKKKKFLGLF
jgi:syntaxin-binding protein 1